MSLALTCRPLFSNTIRCSAAQAVCRSFFSGRGPRSRSRTIGAGTQRAERREQTAADRERPTADPGFLDPLLERRGAFLSLGLRRAHGMPRLYELDTRHRLARPMDEAGADQRERPTDRDTEQSVLRADLAKEGQRDHLVLVDGDEGHDEPDQEQRGQAEHAGDLVVCATGGPRVDIGASRFVMPEPGVGEGVIEGPGDRAVRGDPLHRCELVIVGLDDHTVCGGDDVIHARVAAVYFIALDHVARVLGAGRNGLPVGACRRLVVRAHEDLAVSQTVTPMSEPMPRIQMSKPSLTGPIRPSVATAGSPAVLM